MCSGGTMTSALPTCHKTSEVTRKSQHQEEAEPPLPEGPQMAASPTGTRGDSGEGGTTQTHGQGSNKSRSTLRGQRSPACEPAPVHRPEHDRNGHPHLPAA